MKLFVCNVLEWEHGFESDLYGIDTMIIGAGDEECVYCGIHDRIANNKKENRIPKYENNSLQNSFPFLTPMPFFLDASSK